MERKVQHYTGEGKMARKIRSDITVGSLEKKLGVSPGTFRNKNGRDTRSDKKLGTLRKEAKKKSKQVIYIQEIKNHIEKEIRTIVENVQNLIDKYLINNCEDNESKVFYMRLKADHYRYLCEISKDKDLLEKAEKKYKEAYNKAMKDLPYINSERIGLCLNFALFNYEVKGDKKEGYRIAKNCFEESMKYLEELEKFKSKDALMLIQLLKENLIFWSSEMNEDEQN